MPDSLDDGPVAARKGSKRSAPAPRLGHGEYVVYPGGPTAIYDLLEQLSSAAGDSPDFGTPGISLDRTRLTVRWFGEPPPAVQRLVDGAGFTVHVQQTEFRPGDLRAEAARLAAEHPAVVAAATPRPEGDGIEVLVPPAVAAAAGGAEQALAGVPSAVRLFAEIGETPS
jgi:hypothetical protein